MARLKRETSGGGAPKELHPELARMLAGGFAEVGHAIVLSCCTEAGRTVSVEDCQDFTGYEALVNHIHIEDALLDAGPDELLRQGLAFVSALDRTLRVAYPDHPFQIVFGVGDSYTVRFYRRRPGEDWLVDDLESYEEALLVVDIGP